MSDFDLETAVVAARRRAAEVTNDGSATRLRIRETLARRPARTRRTAILTALMATIFGSTAFAYYAGWRPPWNERSASIAPSVPPAVASAKPRPATGAQRRATATPPTVEAVPLEAAPVEIAETAPRAIVEPARQSVLRAKPAPVPRAPAATPARTIEPVTAHAAPDAHASDAEAPRIAPPQKPDQKPDPELAAYRVAHEAHVRGGDPVAALRAWDTYLAAFPNGALAVDARYSRALILIKLERWSDATNALRPFAEAPAGSYRQAEAARLLAAFHAR